MRNKYRKCVSLAITQQQFKKDRKVEVIGNQQASGLKQHFCSKEQLSGEYDMNPSFCSVPYQAFIRERLLFVCVVWFILFIIDYLSDAVNDYFDNQLIC